MEIRLNKYLSDAGVCSRREADKLIESGRVFVDGKRAEMGMKVSDGQKVCVGKKEIQPKNKDEMVLLAVNKPVGIVCTEEKREKNNIINFLKYPTRVTYIGRLDKDSEGLLLMTNDGELAQKLMHPSHEVNKTYVVKVPGIVPQEKLDLLRVGVKLEDGLTAPAFVNLIAYDHEKNYTLFNISIHEGRNRQVRRMCDFIGFPVRELKRTKMANLTINGLGKGRYRELTEQELAELKKAARI